MSDRNEPRSSQRTLTVRGRGTASADPDIVVLAFGIIGRDPSYSAAVEKLNERVEALRSDLEAAEVDRTRLKTTSFNVSAERHYSEEKEENVLLGYRASHGLRLELEFHRDQLNRVLECVAQSASEATVRISFDISDGGSLRRRAMQAAVADEREAARVLVESAGVTVVWSIS